jgi:hypothetical protein
MKLPSVVIACAVFLPAYAGDLPNSSSGRANVLGSDAFGSDELPYHQHDSNPASHLLWISTHGNDATAVRGSRIRPWRTTYDVFDSSNHVSYGAARAARPGDWIVFEPGTYYVPVIPLNLPGNGSLRGVNLFIPSGTTIIRTNFSNRHGAALPASLSFCGPLIIPGNQSMVIIEGSVVATNDASFDAVFGWASFLSFNQAGYGFTNWAPVRAILNGHGILTGNSDVIYIAGQNSTVNCRNVHLRSRWDCSFFSGTNWISTANLDAVAGASMPGGNGASHGIVLLRGGNWIDQNSSFAATGTELTGDRNAAAFVLLGSTNWFQGTRLVANGTTNVVPLISQENTSYGWYWSLSESQQRPDLTYLGGSTPDQPEREHRRWWGW